MPLDKGATIVFIFICNNIVFSIMHAKTRKILLMICDNKYYTCVHFVVEWKGIWSFDSLVVQKQVEHGYKFLGIQSIWSLNGIVQCYYWVSRSVEVEAEGLTWPYFFSPFTLKISEEVILTCFTVKWLSEAGKQACLKRTCFSSPPSNKKLSCWSCYRFIEFTCNLCTHVYLYAGKEDNV